MIRFTQHKQLDIHSFSKHLHDATITNQFTNYGKAVAALEQRARTMLKISSSKAVIATSSGASALNTIIQSIRTDEQVYSQDFTFPCAFQLPDVSTISFDLDDCYNPDVEQLTNPGIVIITNCFGHVVDIDRILAHTKRYNQKLVFDNAASPYSFYNNKNISNYGIASFISLHHTKPIGFGEGGLVIIDKEYEVIARSIINFGLVNGAPMYKGSNYKMSELSAAGILQWWDSFDIEVLKAEYVRAYYKYKTLDVKVIPNYSDNFFPNCLPVVQSKASYDNMDVRKYYAPNKGLKNSISLYNKIRCIPLTEFLND